MPVDGLCLTICLNYGSPDASTPPRPADPAKIASMAVAPSSTTGTKLMVVDQVDSSGRRNTL